MLINWKTEWHYLHYGQWSTLKLIFLLSVPYKNTAILHGCFGHVTILLKKRFIVSVVFMIKFTTVCDHNHSHPRKGGMCPKCPLNPPDFSGEI